MVQHLVFDLRHAFRALARRPAFSAVVIVTMAVGIGANVAIFTYLSYFLWPAVEAPEPDRLVRLYTATADDPTRGVSLLDFRDLQEDGRVFSQLAASRVFGASLAGGEATHHAWGRAVAGDYFELFGAKPAAGRLLTAEDDRPGAEAVAVLSHLFWQRRLGGDPEVLGRSFTLDGRQEVIVVGVAPAGFQGEGLASSIYVPIESTKSFLRRLDERANKNLWAIGRLRPGLTRAEAQASLASLATGLDEAHPEDEPRRLTLAAIDEVGSDPEGDRLITGARVLMAAVALLLALACANVANLMLARATSRRREMAVHAALGAQRGRLARRLLIESLLLATAGGVAGLVLARWALGRIEGYLFQTVPVGYGDWGAGSSIVADPGTTSLFFAGVCALTGLLFGLAPVLQLRRADLVSALKTGSAGGSPRRRLPARRLLVVAQVALSVVLLLGAGLLARHLMRGHGVELGFEPRGLTLATLYAPNDRITDSEAGWALYRDLLERVRALPEVRAASLVHNVPLSPAAWQLPIALEPDGEVIQVRSNHVAPGYFETLGVALLAGRDFDARDRRDAPGAAVVNQAAAERFWPGESPLGRTLSLREGAENEPLVPYTVVGVVADSRYERPMDAVQPLVFFNLEQRYYRRLTLLARSSAPLDRPLREILHRHHPEMAIIDLVPFDEQLYRSLSEERLHTHVAGSFGLLGLLLATLGVFSVTSYAVSRRVREIGLRMALGATAGEVRRWVLGMTAKTVAAGVVIGLAASWMLATALESLVFGLHADLATFAAVPAVLVAAALLAALWPARRAARVEPMSALREE